MRLKAAGHWKGLQIASSPLPAQNSLSGPFPLGWIRRPYWQLLGRVIRAAVWAVWLVLVKFYLLGKKGMETQVSWPGWGRFSPHSVPEHGDRKTESVKSAAGASEMVQWGKTRVQPLKLT